MILDTALFNQYISHDVLVICLILVFSVICLDSWGYIGWGFQSGYLKSFVLFFFSSFSFFSFIFFIFFFCLSLGGPFSSLAPGHCPPMPPSCYATDPQGVATTPLRKICLGKTLRIGHSQINLSDHVSLKIRNTYIKLDFSATRPG